MIRHFAPAALAALAFGWWTTSMFDGIAAAKEAVEVAEERKLPPEAPPICSVVRPESKVSWPGCMFPAVGQ